VVPVENKGMKNRNLPTKMFQTNAEAKVAGRTMPETRQQRLERLDFARAIGWRARKAAKAITIVPREVL
jgi:hypothetical protein